MKQFEIFSLGSKEQQHILGGTGLGEYHSSSTNVGNSENGNHGGPHSANPSELSLLNGGGHEGEHSGNENPKGNGGGDPSSPFIEELLPYAGGFQQPRP